MTKTFLTIDEKAGVKVAVNHKDDDVILTVNNFFDVLKQVYLKGIEKGNETPLILESMPMTYEDGYKKAIEDVSELFAKELGDEPCNYNSNDEYVNDYEDDWCEEHCGNCTESECWEKFITEKLKELRCE